jgi:hypothetical protein
MQKFTFIVPVIASLFITSFFLPLLASAQTEVPEVIVTWRTRTSAPASYQGKLFPSQNASFQAAVELIEQKKSVDLSKTKISWILNDRLMDTGVGHASFSFIPTGISAQTYELAVRIDRLKGTFLEKVLTIPNAPPQIVIDAPYPKGIFSSEGLLVRAIPYFYPFSSLPQLLFTWTADGRETTSQGDNELQLTLPGIQAGKQLSINVRAISSLNPLLSAADSISLTFKKP